MRVLLIHRYFWPDTPPYAHLLRHIAAALASEHEVTVLSTQPSYKPEVRIAPRPREERLDGFTIRRIRLLPERSRGSLLRSVNALLFAARVFFHVLASGRYDAVMISTSPPIAAALAAGLAARLRGASFVYHCQDLHPEVALYSLLLKRGALYRLLQRLDASNCRRASRVVVLSEDMKSTLRRRAADLEDRIEVINNFALAEDPAARLPAELARQPGKFRIMFAGNIGRFQGLERLIEVARLLAADGRVEFVFLGDGAAKKSLMTLAQETPGATVRFVGHVPIEVASRALSTADLCVVSLSPDIYRVAYPSKTMSYLSAGKPLLVLVEEGSELARLVREQDVGLVVSGHSTAEIAREMLALVDDPARLRAMSQRAALLGQQRFAPAVVLPRWQRLFRELAAQRSHV